MRSDAVDHAAPASCPAKGALLRFSAMGRIVYSTVLLSIPTRPSVRKRPGPSRYLVLWRASPRVTLPMRGRGGGAASRRYGQGPGPSGLVGRPVALRDAAADPSPDGREIADEHHAFPGHRRGSGAGDPDQRSAGMSPAMRQPDARTDPLRCDQAVISGITVDQ